MIYSFGGGEIKGGYSEEAAYNMEILEPENFDYRKIELANFGEAIKPGAGPIGEYAHSGYRVSTDYLPTKMRYDDAPPPPLDIERLSALTFCSDGFRQLVERLEPGVHQFEPIEYVRSDGSHVADMYVFFICQRLDTVDHEHTNLIFYKNLMWLTAKHMARRHPEALPPGVDLEAKPKMVYDHKKVGGHYLWREIYELGTPAHASEALVNAVRESGLTGMSANKQETV